MNEYFVYSMIEVDKVWMVKEKVTENVKIIMKSRKLSLFLSLMVFLGVLNDVRGKEVCPKMCTCDVFEGFRRADCR